MKIRDGFVSNSSSSSFTCLKCGRDVDGWDWEDNYKKRLCPECFDNDPNYVHVDTTNKILDLERRVDCLERENDRFRRIIVDVVAFMNEAQNK